MNTQRIITLEGKSRLPLRTQEAVVELGSLLHHTHQSFSNGEALNLSQSVKSLAMLETTLNNTHSTLKKLEKLIERSSERNAIVEQNVPHITDALDKLSEIDRLSRDIKAPNT